MQITGISRVVKRSQSRKAKLSRRATSGDVRELERHFRMGRDYENSEKFVFVSDGTRIAMRPGGSSGFGSAGLRCWGWGRCAAL